MKIRAESNKGFLQRFLLIAIVCFGFGLYCLYDGFIAYPKELERSEAYYQLLSASESGKDGEDDYFSSGIESEWGALARSNGWSLAKPKKEPPIIRSDIIWQYGMAFVSFLVGFSVLINYLRSRNAWLELDGQNVVSSWGQTLELQQIQGIDKRKWEKKGISKISYDDAGKTRTLVIDDFKFDRTSIGDILQRIESSVVREAIVGGPTQQEIAAYEAESDEDAVDE